MSAKTLQPESLIVVRDDREKTPWDLSPMQMTVGHLETGDYTLRGFEALIAVERKTLDDYLGCVGTNRERFEREMQRILAFPHRLLVIETSLAEIEAGNYRSRVSPASAIGSLLGWMARGIPVLLTSGPQESQKMVSRWLYVVANRRWRENFEMFLPVTKPQATRNETKVP